MVEYFENNAISQSKLKLLLSNPKAFNTVEDPELYFEEKKHFIIGSGVDCLITQSQEEFERLYHVSNVENKPSDTIKSIVNMVFDNCKEEFDELGLIVNPDYKEFILDACESHGYQSRWNEDTKHAKICEAWEYWEDLKAAYGKQILSNEEYDLISQIVMSIKTNEATIPYFQNNEFQSVYYQVPIYFDYEGISCKALLDMVIVNHKDNTIQPIDIKTMGDYTLNFPKSLRQRRYDIQAAFYTEALKSWEHLNNNEILPFKFIVESTIDPGTPLIYTCDKSLLEIGKFGRPQIILSGEVTVEPSSFGNNIVEYGRIPEVLGFHQLIELYKYHIEHGFEKSKLVNESKSELSLDWSGII